jgi:hypothetical protein
VRKEDIVIGSWVAFQPLQNQGPYRAKVVRKTGEYKGIILNVNYTHTLYNPRPLDKWSEVAANGKSIIALWDEYARSVEKQREQQGEKKERSRLLHQRSEAIIAKLGQGVIYSHTLSTFTFGLDAMEKILGLTGDDDDDEC